MGPRIQLFGRKDSRGSQRAVRFFRERRVDVSYVDVAVRPPAPGELRRFAERFGADALLDSDSPPYRDGGLGYMRLTPGDVMERLMSDPRLLRLPLVRCGDRLTVGVDEAAWKEWLTV